MPRFFWFSLVDLRKSLGDIMRLLINLSVGQNGLGKACTRFDYTSRKKEACEPLLEVMKHKILWLIEFRKRSMVFILVYVFRFSDLGGFEMTLVVLVRKEGKGKEHGVVLYGWC